ncbi:aldolase/citrate lyase family protein [Cupriavidus basilensis]|uniref:Aldolase/citrate lyase family protein n=1 Tax=Cupriavidus basilensis TaxID=68895 RepID=A0ABT6AVQ3_9BURK|nr:aldolase/citrate lyase family protein [Cupriavidus basilensis]MDF3836706.1 aldolase/citrate lyase family protein [Cupriavidus basilensis]
MKESARELVRNGVKEKLARNKLVVSMTVRLVRTIEIAEIARTAGFDSIYIDLEHSSLSLDTTGQICMAGLAVGITPFVRIASTAPEYIARVLDGGALGVIAPHIQSSQDAAQIVRAAKFPPLGARSFTGSLPHLRFRTFPTAEIFEALNEATMVIVMIESAEALAKVDEIIAVDGVDMLFIGTNDLCSSLNIPGQLDHELIRNAYSRSIEACQRHGKQLGIGGLSAHPKFAAELVDLGARYFSTGSDLSFLLSAAATKAKQMRDH